MIAVNVFTVAQADKEVTLAMAEEQSVEKVMPVTKVPQDKQVKAEIVDVKMIWNGAVHSAFTNLNYLNGKFYCVFREGVAHSGGTGNVRVLVSDDCWNNWQSTALLEYGGRDMRAGNITLMPDGRYMITGAVGGVGTYASFSNDAATWSPPQIVIGKPWWLYRSVWRGDTCWGLANDCWIERKFVANLVKSSDGINWTVHLADIIEHPDGAHRQDVEASESILRFDAASNNAYAVIRRNNSTTLFGKSSVGSNFKDWSWYDLANEDEQFICIGGPEMIETPYGWIVGGRMWDGFAAPHTGLAYLDVVNNSMEKILELPSRGDVDNSYPGFVWHDNLLYVSYYSKHEGNCRIYMAKIRLTAVKRGDVEKNKAVDFDIVLGSGAVVKPDDTKLVAHWKFDETGGATASEKISGNNGTLIGGLSWQQSKGPEANGALAFDGGVSYVTHNLNLPGPGGTISHWLKPDDTSDMIAYYESNGGSSSYDGYGNGRSHGSLLEVHTGIRNNHWHFTFQRGAGSRIQPLTGSPVVAATWTHVAVTWKTNDIFAIYVNGVKKDSRSNIYGSGAAATCRVLGATGQTVATGVSANGRQWDGLMDDVRVYNYALSAEEINWLAMSTNPN